MPLCMRSFKRVGQQGPLTRLMPCTKEELATYTPLDDVDTYIAPSFAQDSENGDSYPPYNKPGAVTHWLRVRAPHAVAHPVLHAAAHHAFLLAALTCRPPCCSVHWHAPAHRHMHTLQQKWVAHDVGKFTQVPGCFLHLKKMILSDEILYWTVCGAGGALHPGCGLRHHHAEAIRAARAQSPARHGPCMLGSAQDAWLRFAHQIKVRPPTCACLGTGLQLKRRH